MLFKQLNYARSTVWYPTRLISLCVVCFGVLQIQIAKARSSILQESLASIQSKALAGDVHYQGALAIFHKFGEKG